MRLRPTRLPSRSPAPAAPHRRRRLRPGTVTPLSPRPAPRAPGTPPSPRPPGPVRPLAAQRRRRTVRPGRSRRRGQLHRPVPDGRDRPPPPRRRRPGSRHPRRRRPGLACLGVALALHGRRALRARTLNLASVAASVFMNAIAAEPGWRNLAIWPCPPSLTPWPATPSSASSAPGPSPSTTTTTSPTRRPPRWPSSAAWSSGSCAWPWPPPPPWPGSAPGCWPNARSPPAVRPRLAPRAAPEEGDQDGPVPGSGDRTAGSLASIPLYRVAGISADLAPQLDLNTGAARTALRKAVLAARNGDLR